MSWRLNGILYISTFSCASLLIGHGGLERTSGCQYGCALVVDCGPVGVLFNRSDRSCLPTQLRRHDLSPRAMGY